MLVIDRRDHIAGNAYDYYDEHGVLVHKYGPHIFHTNSREGRRLPVAVHRVAPLRAPGARAGRRASCCRCPINRTTINELYGLELSDDEQVEALPRASGPSRSSASRNSEDVVVAKVGRDLYEKFFRGYTRKQWQRDPSELHASVCARIPVRTNTDDRYFTDAFQNMPADGYTAMFERHARPPADRGPDSSTDYYDVATRSSHDHLVWTGPIDGYFDYRFGALPYRSLEFELRTEATPDGGYLLPHRSLNEPGEDVPYTRTTEFRAPDRPGRPPSLHRGGRVPAHRGRSLLPDPHATRPASCTSATRRWRASSPTTSPSSAASRATST